MSIPFNQPFIADEEVRYVVQVVMYGIPGGEGTFTKK